jgi:hypothetical protein
MAAMKRLFVSAKNAHPIATRNSGQRKMAKLHQVMQTTATSADDNVPVRAVVVDKGKPWRFINNDSDVERGQVAMNKAGTLQTPDLRAKGA